MMKPFIDLANMAKGLMDENQQLSAQKEQKNCFPVQESHSKGREHHRVGAGELSASTTTDTNASFATPSTINRVIAGIWGSETCGDFQ